MAVQSCVVSHLVEAKLSTDADPRLRTVEGQDVELDA